MKKNCIYLLTTLSLFGILFSRCKQRTTQKTDILISHMDTTVIPGNDFFDYANGNWFKNNPIPQTESHWGIGQLVKNEIDDRLRAISEDAAGEIHAEKGSVRQKIGDFWRSGMDSMQIEKNGVGPLQNEIDSIQAIRNKASLLIAIAHLKTIGVSTAFSAYVVQDDKNSGKMIYRMDQGGLGLPNRDYYLKDDDNIQNIRKKYANYIVSALCAAGYDSVSAGRIAPQVIDLETALAKASRKLEDLRDPYANYHKMTVKSLDHLVPGISWSGFLADMGIHDLDSVVVGQPEFYTAMGRLLSRKPLAVWKAYLQFHLISTYAPALNKTVADANFYFYHTVLNGQTEQQPRWKRVLNMEQETMGELLGRLFVKNYFSPKTKKRYVQLVDAMMASFKMHITQLDWMSDSTKQYALYKLSKISKKVGYPDHWKDYSDLDIVPNSLVKNIMAGRTWRYKHNIGKLGKPVDREEWHMTPQTYNAYYNPSNNEIVLPAAIFTVPGVPDSLVDDAIVYGYAGASTIGHELTHGFDDEGRLYDADGNLRNWWTVKDAEKFEKRTALLARQFDAYMVLDSLHLNGQATLGENLADLGGLVLGIDAFKQTRQYKEGKTINGLTPMQRYFLGYALGWLVETRKERLLRQVLSDVHAPAKFRVNGPMSNIPTFYQAFDVKPGQKMYRPDSSRVRVW